jgi:hypothetical protein
MAQRSAASDRLIHLQEAIGEPEEDLQPLEPDLEERKAQRKLEERKAQRELEEHKEQRELEERKLEERKAEREFEERKVQRELEERKAGREFEERKAESERLRTMPAPALAALESERANHAALLESERARRKHGVAARNVLRETERQMCADQLRTRIRALSKRSVTLENRSALEHALLAWFRATSSGSGVVGFAAQWKDIVNNQLIDPVSSTIKAPLWAKLLPLGVSKEAVSTVISNLSGIAGNLNGKAHDGSVLDGVGQAIGGCDAWKEIAGTVAFLMEEPAVMRDQILPCAIRSCPARSRCSTTTANTCSTSRRATTGPAGRTRSRVCKRRRPRQPAARAQLSEPVLKTASSVVCDVALLWPVETRSRVQITIYGRISSTTVT